MVTEFEFPDVGEGTTEGKLIEWKVSEGDTVEEDQTLAEVETDKAVVDVPSPMDGTILGLHAEEGTTIKVGQVIATLGEEGESMDDTASEEPAEQTEDQSGEEPEAEPAEPTGSRQPAESDTSGTVKAMPAARKYADEHDVPLQAVDPSGNHGQITKADVEAYLEDEDTSSDAQSQKGSGERILATPSTRKYARENDVDLQQVDGSGPAGRITREDVDRFLEEGPSESEPEKQTAETREPVEEAPVGRVSHREPSLDDYDFEQYGSTEREDISQTRKAIAKQMVTSKQTIPHVTATEDAIVTELWDVREQQKEYAAEQDIHLTFLPFIAKAVLGALEEYPYMNASFDEDNMEIIKKDYYNLGVAVATDHGLMVPVLEDADDMSIMEMADAINTKAQKAREKELGMDDLRGGTFTITNYGSIGTEYGTPIINHPEVGILGTGRIREKPVVKDGEVTVEKVLPLSLTFDHRIIDGAYGAKFLMEVVKHLEDPNLMLVDD